ncbi:MAG TPA: MBL fold metallo-hydrolase [Armatimonadetes bacterium]|jgi:phosphoribosyl 1,2-cyclic phosphodiesterase|nr:MBL fold metallo-hydrolase [Armatimonadota bacterium]
MRVEIWGARGSIAAPGELTVRYGGNTACVSVGFDNGEVLILDAGTGIRRLGNVLARRQPVSAHLFLSHCHWDHIQGFPFFKPAYLAGTQLRIYSYHMTRQQLRKTMTDQMVGAYFPMDFSGLSASIEFLKMDEHSLRIGPAQVTAVETNHPGGGVGFRIAAEGHAFVYLTDNELAAGNHKRFIDFCRGADLLIHDAQYLPEELESHRGWGHSSYLEVLDLARAAGVRRVALFHHDPDRTDAQIEAIIRACHEEMRRQGDRFDCFASAEGMTLAIPSAGDPDSA